MSKRLCVGCNEEKPAGHSKCLMCGSQSFYVVKRDKTEKKGPRRRKDKKTPLGQFSDGPDTKSLASGVSRPSKDLGNVLKEEAESLMTYYCNSCSYAFKMISTASGDYEQSCMKCGSSDLESQSTPIETDDSVRSFMYE